MSSDGLTATFHDSGRKAAPPPHPGFEQGLVLDASTTVAPACAIDLPWPAVGIGTWEVRCGTCGIGLTAAGRIDDPRRVLLACGRRPLPADVRRRPWRDDGDGRPEVDDRRR